MLPDTEQKPQRSQKHTEPQVQGQGLCFPKGPSTQIVGFQGPKTIQGTDFGTSPIQVLGLHIIANVRERRALHPKLVC